MDRTRFTLCQRQPHRITQVNTSALEAWSTPLTPSAALWGRPWAEFFVCTPGQPWSLPGLPTASPVLLTLHRSDFLAWIIMFSSDWIPLSHFCNVIPRCHVWDELALGLMSFGYPMYPSFWQIVFIVYLRCHSNDSPGYRAQWLWVLTALSEDLSLVPSNIRTSVGSGLRSHLRTHCSQLCHLDEWHCV